MLQTISQIVIGAKSSSARRILAAAAIVVAAVTTPAYANVTEPGTTEIIVITPLSFTNVQDLNFGSVIPGTTAGTVTLNPDGTRTTTNGIRAIGNTHEPARFAGLGRFNQRVDVSLGANSIFITGPGPQMRVRTFTIGSTPTALLTTAPLRFRISNASGAFIFPVGATLEVGANQPVGTYSGTWNITLQYQ